MSTAYSTNLSKVRRNIFQRLKDKQTDGYVDCCKEYKFVKPANTTSFNNKMNALKITDMVLKERYNMNDFFMANIIEPIKHNDFIVIGIKGYPGSGKSELAQKIKKISEDANLKYKNRKAELFLCWFTGDIYLSLKKLKKGDIFWIDESPKTSGKGSRVEKWSVDNALHVIRKMENTFIFVDPKKINVDICDLYLESAGQNRRKRKNRFMILDDNKRYFGHITTKLHSDEEFRNWYESEKNIFIQDTLDKGGKISAAAELKEIEQEELQEDLKEEIEFLEAKYESKKYKDRNIFIYKSRKQGYDFDKISKILGLKNSTVQGIYYYSIRDFLKKNFY